MADSVAATEKKSNSKELTELKATLDIIRDFLTLVELLDALPNLQRTPYNVTRSLYQAVSQGRDIQSIGKQLEGFFGPPKKPAGKALPVKLRFNPTLKYLNGIREEQALYLRRTRNGFFYGALWPWHQKQGNITVHLGYCSSKMTDKEVESLERLTKNRILNRKVFDALDSSEGGMVHGISLASFLHMALLEKMTCSLEVKTSGAVGYLYLHDGELVYAESGSMKNRAAAYEIISWDDTEITVQPAAGRDRDDINQPLMEILTEALRVRSEKKGKRVVAPAAAASVLNIQPTDRYKHLREAQQAPKNHTLRLVGTALLALLMLVAVGMFGFRHLKARQLDQEYRAVLEQVEAIEDHDDKKVLLQYFISSHDESQYVAAAREKIREINNAIELHDYEFVTSEAAKLPVDRNYEAAATALYNQFLEKHPGSPRCSEIQLKISEIPLLIDNVDYAKLKEAVQLDYKNRIEVYLGYLLKHPNGRHRSKVEALLSDMSEDYYGHLMKEIPQCDQSGQWDKCIVLCDNFLKYFKNNYRTTEIENLKGVMEDKRDVAQLMETVQRLGDKFEAAKKILTGYLEKNPDTSQSARIKEKILKLERNLRENHEWQTVAAYTQNSDYSLPDRINTITHYIQVNPTGRFGRDAQLLLTQLQNDSRALYQARIEEQRRRQQAQHEQQQKRFEAERARIISQVRKAGARFQVVGNDTFIDSKTGLMWCLLDSVSVGGACQDFAAAQKYVSELTTGGHRDWRLPFGSELAELYKTPPFFPGQSAPWYWTTEVFVKGYSKTALVVTSAREAGFRRQQNDLYECGAVRAVRP